MLAFVHIMKTAGTTLTSILRRSFGVRHFDTRGVRNLGQVTADELRRVCVVYRRLDSIAGHSIRPFGDLHEQFPGLRYYTFLREPVSRTLSHFTFAVRRLRLNPTVQSEPRQLIRDFLDQVRNTQTIHLAGCEDADAAIEILRQRIGLVGLVERFDESLLLLRSWAGRPALDISYVPQNVSSRDHVPGQNLLREAAAANPEVARWITAANEHDLRLYRWVQDELYPLQCQAYGPSLPQDLAAFQAANDRPRLLWIGDSLWAKFYRNVVFKPWKVVSGLSRAA